MRENLVRLTIEGIRLTNKEDLPVVQLRDQDDARFLTVQVGPFEANAIIMMLKGIRLPRMQTHELFAYFMAENKFTISKVLIFGKTADTRKATMFYKRGRKARLMEVRPSDGIALALQFQSPIFAPDDLLLPKDHPLDQPQRVDTETGNPLFIENDKSNLQLM